MGLRMTIIFSLTWILLPVSVYAQDDAPWWRTLFPQTESAEGETESEGSQDPGMPEVELISNPRIARDEANASGADVQDMPLGAVHWFVPEAIQDLDTLKTKPEEVRIPGFRVQLFMGRLDSARSLRNHIQDHLKLPYAVHLNRYPPVFGLQVGDFRTTLAAHRAKKSLRGRFPDALVVPANLTPEDAYPVAGNCIRTP